jgi:hypothetical protein
VRKLTIVVILFFSGATSVAQSCGPGSVSSAQVDCCGTVKFVNVCKGVFGTCNSVSHTIFCTSSCAVFSAGECLSAANHQMPTQPDFIPKDRLSLAGSGGSKTRFATCGGDDSAFTSWLEATSSRSALSKIASSSGL